MSAMPDMARTATSWMTMRGMAATPSAVPEAEKAVWYAIRHRYSAKMSEMMAFDAGLRPMMAVQEKRKETSGP
jgi:hypothetical protein